MLNTITNYFWFVICRSLVSSAYVNYTQFTVLPLLLKGASYQPQNKLFFVHSLSPCLTNTTLKVPLIFMQTKQCPSHYWCNCETVLPQGQRWDEMSQRQAMWVIQLATMQSSLVQNVYRQFNNIIQSNLLQQTLQSGLELAVLSKYTTLVKRWYVTTIVNNNNE